MYLDLLDTISPVNMAGYCSRDCWEWENKIATPALEKLGYSKVTWSTGERDSFGPLSRIASAIDKEGNKVKFVYG